MKRPMVALTMGDPAGVGPELCVRALTDEAIRERLTPIVFGDEAILRRAANALGVALDAPSSHELAELVAKERPGIFHIPGLDLEDFHIGRVSADTGRVSVRYVDCAIESAQRGEVDAITTGPIHKEAIASAGIQFPGHTEILADRTGVSPYVMMQYSERITCAFVTTHVGYAEVPSLLTKERILDTIELSVAALTRLRGRAPKIVVCGLNPHAGEAGLFGDHEEERVIAPAIESARAQGLDIEGPLPADTAFIPKRLASTDVFVCMYHDQGHIPIKALAFDQAVNTTLGLPIIRTSVDHGTALDIAWQGKANPGSLFSALRLAADLVGVV